MFFLALGVFCAYHGCFMSGSPGTSWPYRLYYLAMAVAGLAMINWACFASGAALLAKIGRGPSFVTDGLRVYHVFSEILLFAAIGVYVMLWAVAACANLMRGDQLGRLNLPPGERAERPDAPPPVLKRERTYRQNGHVEDQWHT
jgi:hypothetical protein